MLAFLCKNFGFYQKLWEIIVWLIALSSNYKSLVDLFKGRGCGQSPQILSAYAS
jgi:hypothetical protein